MVRMFNDSAFIASARVQISEQINQCLNDLGGLNSVVKSANIAKLDDNGLALINEVKIVLAKSVLYFKTQTQCYQISSIF